MHACTYTHACIHMYTHTRTTHFLSYYLNTQELETEWEKQQISAQLLQNQLKRLQDDLRKVSRQLDRDSKEKAINTGKIEELNLHIDSLQRELRKAISTKQVLPYI